MQESHGPVVSGPEWDHKDSERPGAFLPCQKAESVGAVQSVEEKAPERS